MTRRRRILYVQYTNPAGYPPLEHSSRILAEAGWNALFLGTGAHGAGALEFPSQPNIEVRRWKFREPGIWQKLHFFAFNVWAIATAITWRPKWIYASDILACPAALALKQLGFRVLYHEHDSPDGRDAETLKTDTLKWEQRKPSAFQKLLLWSRTKLARKADLCVLPNEKRVEVFQRETGRREPTLCVWNCPSRSEAEIEPEKSEDTFVIFYHGSIVPARLPVTVIEALVRLPSTAILRIAGYETVGHLGYLSELFSAAQTLGVAGRIEFLGSLSRGNLLPETQKAHVGLCLLPMKTSDLNQQAMTGASNKPFEYMACGLALLLSDLPDWKQMFVDPGFARACDPREPENMAEAVRWFIENPVETRNMGERGRQRVLQEWNYETQFEPILHKLESP